MTIRGRELGLVVSLFFAACGSSETAEDGPRDDGDANGDERTDVGGEVEIFSWWTSGGERDALEALIAVHEARVDDAEVRNAAVDFADKAREQLDARMQDGMPPDTFQANAGADLFEWVLPDGEDDADAKVESLQSMAEALGWLEAFDPDVLAAASFDGKLYGVPTNVHRINSLFFRKDLFEKYDLSPPATIEELNALCEEIVTNDAIQAEAPGGRMSCLGLGNKWNWTFSMLTFEMILPALAGASFYESYFLGKEAADDARIRAALDQSLLLYCGGTDTSNCLETGWFNPDVDEIDWDEGVKKLSDKSAMMVAMGDWAKGFFESEAGGSLEPGVHFDVVAFPGSETFVFTSDTFPLPKGASNRDGARSFLRTMGSIEGQIAFNSKKGSIPARRDVDPEEFDAVTQGVMASFESSVKTRALSGLVDGDALPNLGAELKVSLEDADMDVVATYLEANYPTLAR